MTDAFRLTVQNLVADKWTVYFEPEGGWVELKRNQLITVEISGGSEERIPEIAGVEDGVIINAWSGAETRAWGTDGVRLDI